MSEEKKTSDPQAEQEEVSKDDLEEVSGGRKQYDLNPNDLSIKVELGRDEQPKTGSDNLGS